MNSYTVGKKTGTHADALAAIGAADLLRHLDPRIIELEDRFEIRFRKHLTASDMEAVDPGFSYLAHSHSTAQFVPSERILRRGNGKGKAKHLHVSTLDENRMYSILGRMKAYGGPNKVVSRFARMSHGQWNKKVWEALHGDPSFVFSSPLVQLFHPHSGKGYALLKPSGTNRADKTKNRWAEPFLEWLRYRGYFEGAAGWFASGDLRIFCPIPANISYEQFAALAFGFREFRLGGTGVKMDCRAVIGMARLLVQHAGYRCRPCQAIRGIWVTDYKDMGQAHTFMATEQLAIPDWFDLRTAEHQRLWLHTLDEHDTILRRLVDNHADEFALLKQYRETFQTRWEDALPEFVEFLASYGAFLFKKRARDHWLLPQFRATGIAAILRRDPALRSTLRNRGFLAIAAAIRGSTMGPQAARHNGRVDHREIRYGILADLRRAEALGRRELTAQVAAFVTAFNREGVRRRAAGLRAMQIQSNEVEAFAELVAQLPAHIAAGALLCGLATCLPGTAVATDAGPKLVQAESV